MVLTPSGSSSEEGVYQNGVCLHKISTVNSHFATVIKLIYNMGQIILKRSFGGHKLTWALMVFFLQNQHLLKNAYSNFFSRSAFRLPGAILNCTQELDCIESL